MTDEALGAATRPATGPSPPRRRRSSAVRALVGIVVGAVLLVLVLDVTGLVPLFQAPSPPAPMGPLTFDPARTAVLSKASGYAGGGWDLLFADGFDSRAATTLSFLKTLNVSAECPFTALAPGGSANITVPATEGNLSGGTSGAWFFVLRNAGGTVLLATVLNGSAKLVGTLGGLCSTALGFLSAIPSAVIDSSAAVRIAGEAGGSSFVENHPLANLTMAIASAAIVSNVSVPLTWEILLTTCPLLGSSSPGMGLTFDAAISASSGALLSAENTTGTCPSSVPLAGF